MLNTNIKDVPNFNQTSLCNMRNAHELLGRNLRDTSPDSLFFTWYHQAIDHIESEIKKPLSPMAEKSTCSICSIFFKNKNVKFMNKAHILLEPDIVKTSSVKFPLSMVTYKLTPSLCIKFFNLNNLPNNLNFNKTR